MDKTPKQRRPASEWSELIAQWQASGVTARVFAEQHGLNAGTLCWWRTRLRKRETSAKAASSRARSFTEVRVAKAATDPAGGMEVVARSGRVIRLQGAVDSQALVAVLKAVEQC